MVDLYPILPQAPLAKGGAAEVGNKAWNLMRLAQAGLPVPPAFVLPTDWRLRDGPTRETALRQALTKGIARLEIATGLKFGAFAAAVAGLGPLGRRGLHAGNDGNGSRRRPQRGDRRGADPA